MVEVAGVMLSVIGATTLSVARLESPVIFTSRDEKSKPVLKVVGCVRPLVNGAVTNSLENVLSVFN